MELTDSQSQITQAMANSRIDGNPTHLRDRIAAVGVNVFDFKQTRDIVAITQKAGDWGPPLG